MANTKQTQRRFAKLEAVHVIVAPSQRHTNNRLPAPSVTFAVTTEAKRYQVLHHIVTESAPGFQVMNLQPFHASHLVRARVSGGLRILWDPV